MANFKVLLKKNLIEMIRNKRIIIFSVVFVALSLISALTAKFLPVLFELLLSGLEDLTGESAFVMKATVADSYVQYIANFGQIAVLLIGIMFANAISKEKSKGTYASLKMNGVKDKEIVFSHFVSQVILVTVSYLLSISMFVLLNIILFRQIMGLRGVVALTYIYLLMIVTICFSLFASCVCKKSSKAYLLVILSYFGLSILDLIPRINRLNPLHLLTISSNLMYYENYLLKEHLITSFVSVGMCILLVILSLLLVKNNINNKKVITNDNTERV